jgi:hypothetical protein
MEMTMTGRLYPTVLSGIVKQQLNGVYTKAEVRRIVSATKKEYEAIVARTPLMGGAENMMINNMYLGAFLIALYRQIRGEVSLEQYQRIILDAMKQSALVKKNSADADIFSDAQRQRYAEMAKWSARNEEKYPWTWQFTFTVAPDEEHIYLTFTRCGCAGCARRRGCPS